LLTAANILDKVRPYEAELRCLGVRRLGLLGLAARGEADDTGDVDFLVEFGHRTFDTCMDVKEFLDRLFQRQIDLVLADAVKPQLRHGILQETVYG
jgi:uncharacterized protein